MYLIRDNIRLFCDVQGEGEPSLIFVHGWMSSHKVWRDQIAVFRKTHRVVSIDLCGFGQSDKPQGIKYNFELFAEDIQFIIHELGLVKPVLVGWSKGASIGLVYAAMYPEALSKLVLVDGGPKFVATDDFSFGIQPQAYANLLTMAQLDFDAMVRGFIESIFPEPDTAALESWFWEISRETPKSIALNSIENDAKADLRPLLKKIAIPTLICCGELDTICPPGGGQYMHDRIANSKLHIFLGKGHAPFLTDGNAFNDLLQAFIRKDRK